MGKAYEMISTMEGAIDFAVDTLEHLFSPDVEVDRQIPIDLIHQAKGIAFLTVLKAGFVWTGKIGTGLVIKKLSDDKWSAPSAIGTAGVGFGAEAGGEMVEMMVLLNSDEAVQSFMQTAQASTSATIEFAAGPYGRSAGANANISSVGIVPNYTYCHAKGLFGGVGLEGSAIAVRSDINTKFYGKDVTPTEILSGQVEAPEEATSPLYKALSRAFCIPASGKTVMENLKDALVDTMPEPVLGTTSDEVNHVLLEKIKSFYTNDTLKTDLFKSKCRAFVENKLDNESFIEYLEKDFSKQQLVQITPLLVSLMSDIDKRKSIWDLCKRSKDQVFEIAATSMPPLVTKMNGMSTNNNQADHNECLLSDTQGL